MRTDVKVGLICLFVLLLGFVGYFALTANKTHTTTGDTPGGGAAPALVPASPGGTVGTGLLIAPPSPTSAPTTIPALTSTVGSAFGSGSGSGSILGPSSAYGSPMISPPATAPAGTVTIVPPGSGARPLSVSATAPSYIGPAGSGVHNPGPSSLVIEPSPAPSGISSSGFGPDTTLPDSGMLSHTPALSHGGIMGGSEYVIQKGDNFTTIAKANHVSVIALQNANPGVNSNKLKIGQKIKLPTASSTSPPPAIIHTAVTTTRPSGTATTHPASSLIGSTYTVKKGDSLQKIASAAYGDAKLWRLIWRANREQLPDANTLEVGTKLKIPTQ